MDAEVEAGRSGPEVLSLDPFGYWPGMASRIAGVGGTAPGHDPLYAFHTLYVPAARGPATFTIRFANLKARRGTLLLRVHMLPDEPGSLCRLANSERITLNRLIASGGAVSVSFEGFRGMTYAVYGAILDDTDAHAQGVTVELDRPDDGSDHAGALQEARSTVFGNDALRPTARLVSMERATLADPVSQMCTAGQFDEPAYDAWLRRMKADKARHRRQWEFVYILQVLERYGMLHEGSRGVGFGCGAEPLPSLMAAMGAEVTATDMPAEHADTTDMLHWPALCEDATFRHKVVFRPVDVTAIPHDLVNYDFAWSSRAYEHLGSVAAGLKFVQNTIECLRPGGIAVHISELSLTPDEGAIDDGERALFQRRDVERLALTLISHGHEVAQLKFDPGDRALDTHVDIPPPTANPRLRMALGRDAATSFGIIVRKKRLPL